MATTKREEVREFLKREIRNALGLLVVDMSNKENAEVIRAHRDSIATQVSWHIQEQYRFLELCDIMEWKRTRERR